MIYNCSERLAISQSIKYQQYVDHQDIYSFFAFRLVQEDQSEIKMVCLMFSFCRCGVGALNCWPSPPGYSLASDKSVCIQFSSTILLHAFSFVMGQCDSQEWFYSVSISFIWWTQAEKCVKVFKYFAPTVPYFGIFGTNLTIHVSIPLVNDHPGAFANQVSRWWIGKFP